MVYKMLCFVFCFVSIALCAEHKPFVIVVPSYNNSEWYKRNLDSIFAQTYAAYHVLYVDDCSTDGTADLVEAYSAVWGYADKITIIKNSARYGMLYNLYTAVHCCPDDVIIVVLDGDDWFAHNGVLASLNSVYQDAEVWMTYGQFAEYPSGKKGFCAPIPDYIASAHAYRLYDWVSSHLKTFYAGLFKQIPRDYFLRKGAFLRSAGDCATMFSLLELASVHVKYIEDVLYIYNTQNASSVFRTRPLEQLRNMYWVRNFEPLAPARGVAFSFASSVEPAADKKATADGVMEKDI
jgi:glycosyltransferase involved in cell wall biosynthesis